MSIKRYKYCEWAHLWLHSKKFVVKQSTYIRYKNLIINHILPEFGEYTIEQIDTELMEIFIKNKLKSGRLDGKGGLSTKSLSDIIIVIKEIFKYASNYGVVSSCYFDRIPIRVKSAKMNALSILEEEKLLSILYTNTDRYKLGVFICLYTGIRIGELCALQWKDISLKESIIKIKHTIQRLQIENANSTKKTQLIITDPKSNSSIRDIPIPKFVKDMMEFFSDNPNAYILSGKCDVMIEPRTMQYKFKTYLKDANIELTNFHTLRHTFATRCVEAGFDIKTLSQILGHSSVKITLDRYVHSSIELKRNNMEKLKPASYNHFVNENNLRKRY